MFFLPLLVGIPSFREEVCLASSQQRSFQRDGWTSLEFTWFFSMAISTTQCCQSPTVKTPRMDESAKIKQNTKSFSPSFFLHGWYTHILKMFIICNPVSYLPSRPSSSARGVSGWPVPPHLQPSHARWSTSHPKQRWYHSSDDETPQPTRWPAEKNHQHSNEEKHRKSANDGNLRGSPPMPPHPKK